MRCCQNYVAQNNVRDTYKIIFGCIQHISLSCRAKSTTYANDMQWKLHTREAVLHITKDDNTTDNKEKWWWCWNESEGHMVCSANFTKYFGIDYCTTVYRFQGGTISTKYRICDTRKMTKIDNFTRQHPVAPPLRTCTVSHIPKNTSKKRKG